VQIVAITFANLIKFAYLLMTIYRIIWQPVPNLPISKFADSRGAVEGERGSLRSLTFFWWGSTLPYFLWKLIIY